MKQTILIIFFSIALIGCEDLRYSLIVQNNSDVLIHDVRVWYGKKSYLIGVVSPSAFKTISGTNLNLYVETRITWIDADKKPHEQTFQTFDFIPKDYNGGNVRFVYKGNDKFILHYYETTQNFPDLVDESD